jgi:hypothetical protein
VILCSKGVNNVELAASFVAQDCRSDASPTGPDNVSSFEPPREYQGTIGINAFYAVNAFGTIPQGLRTRTIVWNGAAASHHCGLREVLVVGETGTTITHSQYHVSQNEFLLKLEQHHVYIQS